MTLDDHRALAEKLNACVGKVALSGYDHPLMREMFPPDKWFLSKEREKTVHGGGKRTECLWTNYDPAAISGKKGLFV
jgi:DNA adenine methylase